MEDILSLAKKFISIPSVTGDLSSSKEIIEIAKKELSGFQIRDFESDGFPSILVSNKKNPPDQYRILLNAHLDVVTGNAKQYAPEIRNGKLFGRGAYDMKGAVATMIALYKKIANKVDFPFGIQITTDEEVGGANGTAHQIKKGIRADFVITGEGTCFKIVNESKAIMRFKLQAKGRNSHSAYPWLGENAIVKMQKAIASINEKYPQTTSEYNGTTVAVTSISTNNAIYNKIPDHCEAILDARVIADEKMVLLQNLKELVRDEIGIELIEDSDPHKTKPDSIFIKKLKNITKNILNHETTLCRAHGQSDARYFSAIGCEGIEFGPIGGNHHAEDEWVDIKSLEDYYKILEDFLLKF